MLALTPAAARAVRHLMESGMAEGVRIHAGTGRFSRANAPSIQIELARFPSVEDNVLEAAGARLYLGPETMRTLDDKVLDADLTGPEPRFSVLQQAAPVYAG
jgi:Fe-S cluster assembly iron-binding protein IscA